MIPKRRDLPANLHSPDRGLGKRIGTATVVEGSTTRPQDFYLDDGSNTVLKGVPLEHKTPGHAAVFAEMLNNPIYMIALASGKITQEVLDKAANAYNEGEIDGNTVKEDHCNRKSDNE